MPRPRLAEPTTAGDRLAKSRAALADRGGRIVQLRLEPEEAAMLERLRTERNLGTDRAAIVYALATALRRR